MATAVVVTVAASVVPVALIDAGEFEMHKFAISKVTG